MDLDFNLTLYAAVISRFQDRSELSMLTAKKVVYFKIKILRQNAIGNRAISVFSGQISCTRIIFSI